MADTEEKYVLRVQSKEAWSQVSGPPITNEGDWFWVIDEPEGWVPASSVRSQDAERIPAGAKAFDSKEQAEAFAKKWKGHPWWCRPNRNYQVFKVMPVFKQIRIGWEKA